MKLSILTLALVFSFCISSAQGGIEHIKNQPYMKRAAIVNCDDEEGDGLSSRICANLKYQKSDSILVVVFKKLLKEQDTDAERRYLEGLQKEWRSFRDKHCKIIWNKYQGGSIQAEMYLTCLTELTDNRRSELESLLEN